MDEQQEYVQDELGDDQNLQARIRKLQIKKHLIQNYQKKRERRNGDDEDYGGSSNISSCNSISTSNLEIQHTSGRRVPAGRPDFNTLSANYSPNKSLACLSLNNRTINGTNYNDNNFSSFGQNT